MLPDVKIIFARGNDRVLHVVLASEALDGAPALVAVLDVGLLVQLEEIELFVGELEELAPVVPLEPEPADLPEEPGAVARYVDPFRAGIGNDAFQPVLV